MSDPRNIQNRRPVAVIDGYCEEGATTVVVVVVKESFDASPHLLRLPNDVMDSCCACLGRDA